MKTTRNNVPFYVTHIQVTDIISKREIILQLLFYSHLNLTCKVSINDVIRRNTSPWEEEEDRTGNPITNHLKQGTGTKAELPKQRRYVR